jgi:hypothetical protein
MVKRTTYERPQLPYKATLAKYFSYGGQCYPVATAPTAVFRAAILAQAPTWRSHPEYRAFFFKPELDTTDRWYLLNALATDRKGIALSEEPC